MPVQYLRAIVGARDKALDPMVRPGSILLVDTSKCTVLSRKQWQNEFDRPIYLFITRTGYVSGFCELDKKSEWLTVIPHPLSYESNRQFRYKKEIEVVGTASAVFSRRVA